MIRVLITAATEVARAGLESMLTAAPGISVVMGTIGLGRVASQFEELQPDVAVVEFPSDGDLSSLPEVVSKMSGAGIVLLVEHADGRKILEALRSGVQAILPRTSGAEEIVGAIEAAAVSLVVLHPELLTAMLAVFPSVEHPGPTADDQELTPREIEVLRHIAQGLTSRQIAEKLFLSLRTVKAHLTNIFNKMGCGSRTDAIIKGLKQGYITLEDISENAEN